MSEMQTFDELVAQVVRDAVPGHEVGEGAVPSENPIDSYVIVNPGVKRTPVGDMDSLTANRDIVYTFLNVGRTPQEVRWLEDRIEPAMLSAVAVLGAQWVLPEGTSAIVPSGSDLYSSLSTFCIRK